MRWLAILTVLAGCGGAAAGVLEPGPVTTTEPTATAAVDPTLTAIVPGELMRFEVRMAGVLAGEASFTTGEPGVVDGRPAIAVSSRVGTAGAAALIKAIRDDATSVIDLETLRPLSTTGDTQLGDRTAHTEARFVDGKALIQHTPGGSSTRHLTYDFRGETVLDAESAMAVMRIWPAELGSRRVLWVLGGRRLWRAEIAVTGREVLGTALGNLAALKFEGVAARALPDMTLEQARPPRTFTVWVSDDADRVPLKIVAHTELGDATIELVEYQRP